MSWKTLKSEVLINSFHVSVEKNKVQLPDGAVIDDFYRIIIPDAAIVAAITSRGTILLKKEYRYAQNKEIIECPAGMFEKREHEPLEVAKRELLEETGYVSNDWTYLGGTIESTKLTNTMHLFLANNCVKVAEQHLDENEHLDVVEISLKKAIDMVMEGGIIANSSAHLTLKVDRILNSQH